ncbi:MAG: PaaI family thioesterase [Betaproteobacteria bacterium]|nr:PaaI family thioesterase [Betaproteobacteria bacterium]
MSTEVAQGILRDNFAGWVQDLGLRVESTSDTSALLRMPFSDRLVRVGGIICGQAMMAAADTAMVIAICFAIGEFKPIATVNQNISFFRPVPGKDVMIEARVLRLGRTLAFGELRLTAEGAGQLAVHGTTTYALPV